MEEKLRNKFELKKAVYLGIILSIILTWPMAWHFFTGIPGRGVDTYQAIARTVLVDEHIHNDGLMGTLQWQKTANFWGILPFIGYTQVILGQMAGYNLWWFLSFFLAFLGMWLFMKDVTKSTWAAAAAGFVFAFIPFHYTQAVATNIGTMHYEWLAWLAFFLHRFLRSTSWRSAMGVAISIFLIIATEHQLLAFTIIFLIFYFPFLVYLYPQNLKTGRFWAAITLGVIVLFIAGAVQFNKIWQIAHSTDNFLKPPFSQVEDYSADGIDFLIPPGFHTLWGGKFNYLRANTTANPEGRQSFYLGYAATIFFLIGLVLTLKKKKGESEEEEESPSQEKKWLIFWLAISVLFIILSLGPTLHFMGNVSLEKKLPYMLLYNFIPYWNYIRTTSRVFVIVVLGWSFLVGLGAKYLEKYYQSSPKSSLARYAIAVLVILLPIEYLSVPTPNLDLSYSKFYDQLAQDKDSYAILEIPGSTSYDFGSYSLFTGRIHQKNKIDGIDFARAEKDHWAFQRNTPIIESLLYSLPTGGKDQEDSTGGDVVNTDYTPFGASILNFYKIRYVTISKVQTGKKFGPQEFQNTANYIEQKLGLKSVYEDNFLKAYTVPQDKKQGHFIALDTGANDSWGEKQGTGNSKSRTAIDGAKMRLANLGITPINLDVNFRGTVKYIRNIEFLLDGASIKKVTTKDFKADYTIPVNQLAPGEHSLELRITDNEGQVVNNPTNDRAVKFSHIETVQR